MGKLVVVGAGLAAAKLVAGLRELGDDRQITVVGSEPDPPYERPPLSKAYLARKAPDPTVLPANWWAENEVNLRTSTTVNEIDRENRRLGLDGCTDLEYEELVLATGSRPRVLSIPGAEKALRLRTLADARALDHALESSGSLVIIGGGWIGLEVAAAAIARGVKVTVLEAAALPLLQILGEQLATYLEQLHRSHGVEFVGGVQVTEIVSAGDGSKIVSSTDRQFAADQVLLAAGAIANTELATASGLEVANGIVTDEHFITSDPAIRAVGDVACAFNLARGEHLRVEHWDNAIRQAKACAKHLAGQDVSYDWQPYFYTDQFQFQMEYVGHGGSGDLVELRGDLASSEFVAYWLSADSVVTAAMNVGIWDCNDQLRDLIGNRVEVGELPTFR